MKKFKIQRTPFQVPTTDGKTILEHFGSSNQNPEVSIAAMIAPAGWSEPFQTPEFDEYTLVLQGRKQFELEGETIVLHQGESIRISGGTRVRYSNPFLEECHYVSVCLPAFSIETVHREED
ncbi:cupin domain-containing protein [Planobacterium oryzisoli]|uniref:Cupin domain-containing protein n=1 Tax=Planobacterium oryzisoli TaxID=2771435 RepID=A0A931EAG4_9FLAO|nr:cupin domain-containing protein [Planobacterium oryzisoli]MBF5026409.1 cupin domain-containing protein [Planobacterium oryzisoli]